MRGDADALSLDNVKWPLEKLAMMSARFEDLFSKGNGTS